MNFKKIFFNFLFFSLIIAATGSYAQTNLTIDAAKIKGSMQGRGAGFCNSFITDRPELTPNLAKTKAGTLRFPMGTLAKNYLFHNFDKNYTDVNEGLRPRIISRQQYFSGNQDINTATNEFKSELLDFDEFMTMCQSIGAEPVIMLSSQGDLLTGSMITKEQLMRNAIEWVKYAKNKGYKITYWEFGNEVKLTGSGRKLDAKEYTSRYLYLQNELKKIDPNIKLGAVTVGWKNHEDILEMLKFPEFIKNMDFFVTHQYNESGVIDYPKWVNTNQIITNPSWDNTRDEIRDIKRAIKYFDDQISKYPNLANLEYLITEYSTHNAGPGRPQWANGGNHIVQSIFGFQQLANMYLYDQRIKYSHFWVTTSPWGNRNVFSGDAEAFNKLNNWEITPQGMTVLLYNQFMKDNLIQPVSNLLGTVGCYASSSADKQKLTLFVINKNNSATDVRINLENYSGATTNVKWIYSGAGDPYDKNPVLRQFGSAAVVGKQVQLSLAPISLTIIELGKSAEPGQVPESPKNFKTESVQGAIPSIRISFNAVANANFYELEKKEEGGNFKLVTLLDSHQLSYLDVDITTDKNYYYRLKAGNEHGYSGYSEELVGLVSTSTIVRLINGQGNNLALDVANETVVKSTNNLAKPEQVWSLTQFGDYYKILNIAKNKYLSGSSGLATLTENNTGDNVLWKLDLIGGQDFFLQQKSTGQYLAGDSQNSGTQIIIEPYSGWAKQKWTVTPAEDITGVSDVTAGNKMVLFPNPASNKLFLKNVAQGKVDVYTMYGGNVLQKQYYEGESIDVSHLSNGMYLLRHTGSNNQSAVVLKILR